MVKKRPKLKSIEKNRRVLCEILDNQMRLHIQQHIEEKYKENSS